MSEQEVQRIRTPIAPAELVDVLARGHHVALGEPPGENRLRMGWSQVMLENGRGRYVWCHNLGNITTSGLVPYYVERVKERTRRNPDTWEELDVRFRAHPDSISGAADYWRRLDLDFAEALPFFDRGDIHGAVAKLSELIYFTARVEPYERAVRAISSEFDEALWNYP